MRIKKIVLAYSGGLDTSVILKWLKEKYQCQVVAFAADLGQGEELAEVAEKARATGADEVFIEDLQGRVRPGLRLAHVPGQRPL